MSSTFSDRIISIANSSDGADETDEMTSLIHSSLARRVNLLSYGTPGQQEEHGLRESISQDSASSEIEEDEGHPAISGERNDTETRQSANDGTNNDEEESNGGNEERNGAIGTLTRRLRCLFSTITWPIVPLGTIVALALLWVLYAASSLDLRRSCSHPLHWYSLSSLVLVAYIPHHAQVRSHLFQYSRDRDGPIRPARVRMYDQFFHTICLLYVYTGVTLIQTCREDVVSAENMAELLEDQGLETLAPDMPLNSCAATCPNLYQALSVYVATLEMFTFALILPLLFLPCIYLWFLRRATAEAEAFAELQDRLQEEEALLSNGGITADEILDCMDAVKLVSRSQTCESGEPEVWLIPYSATDASMGMKSDVKECCICMNDFCVHKEADLESGVLDAEDSSSEKDDSESPLVTNTKDAEIVRTRCGHVFHKECLSGWVGGRWQIQPGGSEASQHERRRRRARQTCCPLCREDLRPQPS